MTTLNSKADGVNDLNTSLRGESPQEHGRKRKSTKGTEAREVLIALSGVAKDKIEALAILTGEELGVNEMLIKTYKEESGAVTFKTFHDWKKAGFNVNKGEVAYRIWGNPIKAKKLERIEGETNITTGEDEENSYKYWPMCCVFSDLQVTATGGDDERKKTKDEMVGDEQKNIKNSDEINDSPFVTSDYSERLENRKERLQSRADKARSDSNATFAHAKELAAVIPFGQPILVGHHSESRDRKYRGKIQSTFTKSFELSDKADYYERKVGAIDHSRISSNDPEALAKLRVKLSDRQSAQAIMKAANKALRTGSDSALEALGMGKDAIAKIKMPDSHGNVGFAGYQLSNNNAEIKRLTQRINDIEALRDMEPISFVNDDFSVCVENGQIKVVFVHGKPSSEVRAMIHKGARFKWSRYQAAWVRKATPAAVYEGRQLVADLQALEVIYDTY